MLNMRAQSEETAKRGSGSDVKDSSATADGISAAFLEFHVQAAAGLL
jgi:hypothetical protein